MKFPPEMRREPGKAPLKDQSSLPTEANLSMLPEQINAEHEAAFGKAREALDHARRAGELLIEAKAKVGHGKWLPWIEANCRFSESKAQRYIRLAEGWDALALKSVNLTDLTVSGALQLLAKPKAPADPEEDSPPTAFVRIEDDGMTVVTPSVEHPGYCFVDKVCVDESYTDVALRPVKASALPLLVGGGDERCWQPHRTLEGWDNFLATVLPERLDACALLGIVTKEACAVT